LEDVEGDERITFRRILGSCPVGGCSISTFRPSCCAVSFSYRFYV